MSRIIRNNKLYKVIALVLSLVIFITSTFIASAQDLLNDSDSVKAYITRDGNPVSEIVLNEDAKMPLYAVSDFETPAYFWQIRDKDDANRWINISGANSNRLWLTYALISSMLGCDSTAAIRCRLLDGNIEYFTEPVNITLSYTVNEDQNLTQTGKNSSAPLMFATKRAAMLSETDEHTTFTIVINYLFDDNSIAFEPYGASVAKGSDFYSEIKSPTVVGYDPFRRDGENYIDAKIVTLDYKNIQSNITINVVYEPALVDFEVQHHYQNIHDDDYSHQADKITYGKALTGSMVGDGLAFTEEELPGFKALPYEKLKVAADGSTTIEIRYDRIYYFVDFDMNGGYGTEPVFTRFGETVGASDPIRHGYIFDGWELVSYGENTPTAEQQSIYEISNEKTITVPAANLKYRAKWITRETKYTLVFWKENPGADDNGYTYWGYYDGLKAMSGSYVNGEDLISLAVDDTDIDCYSFNSERTDKNVLVEGDGSTVVNVYYTRKFYKIEFYADGICTIEENHSHNDECYDIICGKGHVHSDECVRELHCDIPIHTEHTDDCLVCGQPEHIHGSADCNCKITEHTHTVNCWNNNIGNVVTNISNAPSNPKDGQIYSPYIFTYYIYIKGTWYRYNSWGVSNGSIVKPSCGNSTEHSHGTDCNCTLTAHTHSEGCYKDQLHSHNDNCYTYSCGVDEHTHNDACYRLKCGIAVGHSHNSSCRSSSSESVVKTVYAKYEQSLHDIWPVVTDDNSVTYNSGERWDPNGSVDYSEVLVYISKMPGDDFTLTLSEGPNSTYTMNYYLQALPDESYPDEYNGNQYILDHTIKANYNFVTKDEDFFPIKGFTTYASNPSFSSAGKIELSGSNKTVNFYYNRRTDFELSFNNNGEVIDERTDKNVMYGISLKDYYFVPDYPSNLEPNAYTFSGWYTSYGCFDGTEVDWDTLTMPDGNMILYAKWSPISHRVRVFKEFKNGVLTGQIGSDQYIEHKHFAHAPEGNIENNKLVFQGWFYIDNSSGEPEEKAFVFSGIPIIKDMDIYAKWSSHIAVDYTIHYKLLSTGETIADSTYGTAIAGNNETFKAKAGTELYAAYQTGYYPETNSHTITMSVDGDHTFTFYYVFKESMPYKVRYIDAQTGDELFDTVYYQNNNLSVVTETFKRVSGKMPDAYQKRLVLSANGTEAEDGVLEENVITFYYNSDSKHAYYKVVHYIQNITGDTYREYRSEESVGNIGEDYEINAITLTGFAFDGAKTKVNGVSTPVEGSSVTSTLSDEGMLVELYYNRISVNYKVKYVDNNTKAEIYPEKIGQGVFGEQVVEYAENLESKGYKLESSDVTTRTLSTNEENNVIVFLYVEKNVTIKYQLIGPMGCGNLSNFSENLEAISGSPNGSVPTVYKGFAFIGWFVDSYCTIPAKPSEINLSDNSIKPIKDGEIWTDKTYYAKFVALETDLTISVNNTSSLDENQSYLFRIKGVEGTDTEKVDLTVTVIGDSSVTISKLPTGKYTVTEFTDWSWRYENDSFNREIELEYNEGSNTITFDNIRSQTKWLDGNAVSINDFNY